MCDKCSRLKDRLREAEDENLLLQKEIAELKRLLKQKTHYRNGQKRGSKGRNG